MYAKMKNKTVTSKTTTTMMMMVKVAVAVANVTKNVADLTKTVGIMRGISMKIDEKT